MFVEFAVTSNTAMTANSMNVKALLHNDMIASNTMNCFLVSAGLDINDFPCLSEFLSLRKLYF